MHSPTITPREIFDDPEIRSGYQKTWDDYSNLDQSLAKLDDLPNQQDPVGYLDSLSDTDHITWYESTKLLTSIPADTLYEAYGEEMVLWAIANTSFEQDAKAYSELLVRECGYDANSIEKARSWAWDKQGFSTKGKVIAGQYAVIDTVLNEDYSDYGMQSLLQDSAKDGVSISQKRASDYSLRSITPIKRQEIGYTPESFTTYEGGKQFPIYMDAPSGIALVYKDNPQAVVAVAANNKHGENELMVYQLQGVQGRIIDPNDYTETRVRGRIPARGLAPLDWQKFMISVASKLATDMGFDSIAIQAGEKNYWATTILPREKTPHLSADQARKLYDIPARRLGFSKENDGNWHRVLNKYLTDLNF